MKTQSEIAWRTQDNPPGFETSWAGPNPFGDGFCFGSEEGYIQLMDWDLCPIGPAFQASHGGDSINSVVGAGRWFVASTRSDINFINKDDSVLQDFQMPFGAFQLERTSSGLIVGAVGRAGLVFIDSVSPQNNSYGVSPSSSNLMFAYSVCTVPGMDGTEIICCAGRMSGVMFAQWKPQEERNLQMTAVNYPDLDIIDVCNISTGLAPRAISGVSTDGTLILARDVLDKKSIFSMKFASVRSVVYRIASSNGHLFLLTSEGLIILRNLARDFVEQRETKVFVSQHIMIPIQAIDMNVVMNRYLAVVKVDGIDVFDIESISGLEQQVNLYSQQPAIMNNKRVIRPEWEHERLEGKSEGLSYSTA